MTDSAILRSRARHCRELAKSATGAVFRTLSDIAADLETQAAQLDAHDSVCPAPPVTR